MRSVFWARLAMATAMAVVSPAMGLAQSCDEGQAVNYFKPLTDGDGLRYPITIGPLSWRLMGDAIQPVRARMG
jgi:hypothetical protein